MTIEGEMLHMLRRIERKARGAAFEEDISSRLEIIVLFDSLTGILRTEGLTEPRRMAR